MTDPRITKMSEPGTMMPEMHDREELDAIADLLVHCRDSARVLKLSNLTYHLDMAFVAARVDIDVDRPGAEPASKRFTTLTEITDNGAQQALQLATICTSVEGCRDRANDIDRHTLVYLLDMALLVARNALIRGD